MTADTAPAASANIHTTTTKSRSVRGVGNRMKLLDDLTEATIIRKEPRELEKLCGNAGIEIKLLIDTFRHTHVANTTEGPGKGGDLIDDACGKCSLDLRHAVHHPDLRKL